MRSQIEVIFLVIRHLSLDLWRLPRPLARATTSTMGTDPAAAEEFTVLYRRAFAVYGTHALWNKQQVGEPTPADALVIARALRIEGDREARRLAEQIEQACRATL